MRRLAIVGCGAVLEGVHERALLRLSRKRDLQVVGLIDPAAESRERAAASFPGAQLGDDLDVAMNVAADALLVLSPPHTHAEIVVRGAEAGLDVLCEKPLTDTAEGLEWIAAAGDMLQRVRVAMIRRQFDTHHILRAYKGELIDESDFTITYREGAPFTWPVKSAAPFFRGPSEAGVLVDVGSHVVDLMHWLFGGPMTVRSYSDNATDEIAETDAELQLGIGNGEAFVRLSRRQPLPEGWLIESKRGQVWIPLGPLSTIFTRGAGSRGWKPLGLQDGHRLPRVRAARHRPCTSYDHSAYLQLDQFLFDQVGLQATVQEGLAVTRVLLDAYEHRVERGLRGAV